MSGLSGLSGLSGIFGRPSNDLLTSLIAYWKLDEASGNGEDAHIYDFDLTDSNTVTTATGLVYPAARQFTAANTEKLFRQNESLLLSGDFDFTFACYFYADSMGASGRTIVQDVNGGFWLNLNTFSANKLCWTIFNTSATAFTATFGTDITLSGWYSAIGWYKASTKEVGLQVNSATPVTATLTGTPRVGVAPEFSLGASSARPWDGRIGPSAFWRRLLTTEEKAAWVAGLPYINMQYLVPPQRDVFIIAGQSNASGRGTSNQVWSHATLIPLMYGNDNRIKKLADPTDSPTGQADAVSSDISPAAAGSVWPLVATDLMATTGRATVFVPCAKGGTSITQWLPGADHQDRTTLYGSMVYRTLQAAQYGTLRLAVWWQGETDALAGMSQATYNAHLDTIANAYYVDTGIKLMACKFQTCGGISDADELKINAAIAEAWSDNPNVLTGADLTGITADSGDQLHLNSNGNLSSAAALIGTAIKARLGW